ncbi:MAG: hypothetical protein LBP19_01740, partial [Treponema sp.]|nr:hypothetical protein [Treponema sp.]
ERVISEADFAFARGKLMGTPADAAAVSSAAKTAEDIRGFKTMADEGLITREECARHIQERIGRPPEPVKKAPKKKELKIVWRNGGVEVIRE